MNAEEYKAMFMCEPVPPSERVMVLACAILRYYVTTEHMSNRAALSEQRKLTEYIKLTGFSPTEEREARLIARQMDYNQDYSLLSAPPDN